MAWLQANMGDTAVLLAKFFTFCGSEKFLVAVMAFFYLCWDKETGVFAGINVSLSLVLCPMVKNLALRRRPYMDLEGVKCLVPVDPSADLTDVRAQGWSFPSGHASNSLAIFGSLFHKSGSGLFRAVLLALSLLVGASRVAVGCHYPTDVLGGWVMTLVIFYLVYRLALFIPVRSVFYAAVFACSCAGFFWCRTSDYYSGLGIMLGIFCADLFERRFVNFGNTRDPLLWALRLFPALALFLGVSTALKLPFSEEFLSSGTLAAFAFRTLRYALSVFVSMGLYPMLFKRIERSRRKKEQ